MTKAQNPEPGLGPNALLDLARINEQVALSLLDSSLLDPPVDEERAATAREAIKGGYMWLRLALLGTDAADPRIQGRAIGKD